jgi:hypothetical protein
MVFLFLRLMGGFAFNSGVSHGVCPLQPLDVEDEVPSHPFHIEPLQMIKIKDDVLNIAISNVGTLLRVKVYMVKSPFIEH